MTGQLRPPRMSNQLSATKGRVQDLERRLARATPAIPPHLARFSAHGPVALGLSGPDSHPSGGQLVLVWAKLSVAGSTNTVVDLLRNGVPFTNPIILTPGNTHAELVVSQRFSARVDAFQVEVTSAGTGAESITVFGQFDR